MKKILFLILLFIFTGCTSAPYSSLEDFRGKPSVIMYAGTYCPHCQEDIPVFEKQIWEPYKDLVNIWINVVDRKRFETVTPQGFMSNVSFEKVTGEECGYVPSMVVLNADLEPTLVSCGSDKTIDDVEEEIKSLLKLDSQVL